MPESLALDVSASLNWVFQESLDLTTISDSSRLQFASEFSNGSGDDEADRIWHDQRTLATAATEDLNLTDLTTTIFADTVTIGLATVRALLIVNTASTAGEDLLIGGAGAGGNAWAAAMNGDQDARLVVPADSMLMLVNKKNDWPVTNGSADQLRIENGGAGDITYQIVIAGSSA